MIKDKNKLINIIEQEALLKNEIANRILRKYQPTYDTLFYLSRNLSTMQKLSLYRKIFKFLKKDLRKVNKIEKRFRKNK